MRKYDNLKKSGVEFLGSIPEDWSISKIKYVVNFQKGKNPAILETEEVEGSKVYLTMDFLRGAPKHIFYVHNPTSYFSVKENEILLLWDGANAGEFILAKDGVLSSTMAKVEVKSMMQRYAWYFFKYFEKFLKSSSIGMGIPHVNGHLLRNAMILIPPNKEQKAIATFLDRKTSEIDTLINKKKQLIALLKEERTAIINHAVTKGIDPNVKYKDSGIDWIGEIPEHWEVKRLKHFVKDKLRYGANESAELDNPDFPRYIRITDFGSDGTLKENTFKSLPPDVANDYLLENGDLLFARSGATVGKTFLFDKYTGKACYAGYLIKATFNHEKVNPKIPYYYSKTTYYENWKESIFQQATIQNIGADKYNQFLIAISPIIDEQRDIVSYIEKKSFEIESIINKAEKEIELLQEYKTALISEVVTGKVDVRDEVMAMVE